MIEEDPGEMYLEGICEYSNFDFPGEEYFFEFSESESRHSSEVNDEVPSLPKGTSSDRVSSGGSHVEFKIPPSSKSKLSSSDEDQSPGSSYEAKRRSIKIISGSSQERQSIFVHSSPSQFPDILKARKSAFGTIFVRASTIRAESLDWKKMDSTVSVRRATAEKTSGSSSDSGKKLLSLGLKESIFRAFEKRGIPKDPSTSSSSQWDVYPITESALFSVQVRDQIHQTRHISRIEERILTGTQQFLKFSHRWPTGSMWTGHWDALGMAGNGTYIMPHDVVYHGKMHDGMFHDNNGVLHYPNGFTCLHCKYEFGLLKSCQCRFNDNLLHEEENWDYCKAPDRRYWGEVETGLKPGKLAQITGTDPPRTIPNGCFDTSDGFFNPKTKMLISPSGELLRVPTKSEEEWIKHNCRKGFEDFVGFRPDLFENWYDNDEGLIDAIMKKQEAYKRGDTTLDDLQVFYADHDLLPEHSPYRKNKTNSQMVLEEHLQSCPDPKRLVRRSKEKQGHKISDTASVGDLTYRSISKASLKKSRSSLKKVGSDGKDKSVSKIGFKLEGKNEVEEEEEEVEMTVSKSKSFLRIVRAGKVDSKPILKHRTPEDIRGSDSKEGSDSEKGRNRAAWAQSVPNFPFGPRNEKEKCLELLKELHESIPDEEEFGDSDVKRTCHFKKLSEDKFNNLKYWGKRMITLNFED